MAVYIKHFSSQPYHYWQGREEKPKQWLLIICNKAWWQKLLLKKSVYDADTKTTLYISVLSGSNAF